MGLPGYGTAVPEYGVAGTGEVSRGSQGAHELSFGAWGLRVARGARSWPKMELRVLDSFIRRSSRQHNGSAAGGGAIAVLEQVLAQLFASLIKVKSDVVRYQLVVS